MVVVSQGSIGKLVLRTSTLVRMVSPVSSELSFFGIPWTIRVGWDLSIILPLAWGQGYAD